ncbi:hypothetical protein Tco_0975949 [Tanacetum coccineum]|uniref:Uncharacterized protein n=1 Tax=Tanacetum coccineum TaxID=301880 RepID=A0ABQ5EGA3_9ASTR
MLENSLVEVLIGGGTEIDDGVGKDEELVVCSVFVVKGVFGNVGKVVGSALIGEGGLILCDCYELYEKGNFVSSKSTCLLVIT